MKQFTAQPLDLGKYRLGEGPYFDPDRQRLSWVDILAGELHCCASDGTQSSFCLGQPLGAAVPLADSNGFVLAAQDGLYALEENSARRILDLTPVYQPFQRSNDAKADPAGRLWFGASLLDGAPHDPYGDLYCFDAGVLHRRQPDTRIANGMAWSLERSSFYFSDSGFHAVFVYDYDAATGAISSRRVLFQVEQGVPDGLCIDASGDLWVAIWGGRRVEYRSGRDGSLLGTVSVEAEHVTSCCFGGEDLRTLYITTAGEDLSGPWDGSLFSCEVDAQGLRPDLARLGSL